MSHPQPVQCLCTLDLRYTLYMCLPEQDSQQQHMTRAGGGGRCITTTINSLHPTSPGLQSAVWLEAWVMDAEDLSNSKPGSCHSCHQCGSSQDLHSREWSWHGRGGRIANRFCCPAAPPGHCLPLTICLVTSQHSHVAALDICKQSS